MILVEICHFMLIYLRILEHQINRANHVIHVERSLMIYLKKYDIQVPTLEFYYSVLIIVVKLPKHKRR
jgi:hypothetical protein